jgi:16S rRNA (guanine1207-N2)-methyltransferase
MSRLSLAIDAGFVPLPDEGVIAVWGPSADADLAALPQDRVFIIQPFKPDHDAWAARGYTVSPLPEGRFAHSIVFLPRAKDAIRARIADAASRTDGAVSVDGLKVEGVESVFRDLRKMCDVTSAFSKQHGKAFTISAGADLSAWAIDDPMQNGPDGFKTSVGVFSAGAVDKGSAALAAALPMKLPAKIMDMGSGWGWLSAQILKRDNVAHLDMVEADHAAHLCAAHNVTDERAHLHWADATRFKPEKALYDAVISNPPFHTSRTADPAIGRAFLAAGASVLHPGGQMWIVANRHLPYEGTLSELFADVKEIAGDASFKVLHARKPRRRR